MIDDNSPTERIIIPSIGRTSVDIETMRLDLENALWDASCLRRELESMGREFTEKCDELAEVKADLEETQDRCFGLNAAIRALASGESEAA